MLHSTLKRKKPASNVDIDYPLKKVFQKQAFRPLQREIIIAALDGHDIFVQAATSFGKSLCFQLPAWCSKGVTVVISPLLALVQNQVNAANNFGVTTYSITSNTPFTQRKEIEADLQCGHPHTRLLYVTPELCSTENFRKILRRLHQQGQLIRVTVDEAHCISEWGHDFRPAYKDLKWLKANLQCPSVPIMALTATATPKVRKDIYKYLNLKEANTLFFSTSTARPNIHYEIQYFSESNPRDASGDDIYPYLLAWLTSIHNRRVLMIQHMQAQAATQFPSTRPEAIPSILGIIYVNTRNLTESLAAKLQASGINAQAYHAGLEPQQRLKIQSQFVSASTKHPMPPLFNQNQDVIQAPKHDPDETDISRSFTLITATNAFGMGIDIPTIRFVVHYGLPRNLESFIQESGRAGRDGKAAQSLILYTREERDRTIYRVKMDISKEARHHRDGGQSIPGGTLSTQTQPQAQAQQRMNSLQKVIEYCENVATCRHKLIGEYFGQPTVDTQAVRAAVSGEESGVKVIGPVSSKSIISPQVCDYACDLCKEGATSVKRRRDRGLASDEEASQFTQRENWDYE
ncbi:hypothetical protein H2198_000282 [Neophaeococcomyces mojaviensis]|uniref:Uncharacterized protein n=1 Tax=Neophaeococcomyces mojaviensis TaxID=3383035 RepID=A0ACC3AK89_9EURO|nr:hypothetical protein H2198_000282 [Knufia sp. JES_112]